MYSGYDCERQKREVSDVEMKLGTKCFGLTAKISEWIYDKIDGMDVRQD